MLTQLFFGYCALMIIMSGILAISLRNPVHCVLMVLVMFLHMAGLYLTLNAEFLAAVQIIVYAGAVLVLYLFVLFLVSLRDEIRLNPFVGNVWIGRGIAIGLALALITVLPSFIPGERGDWPLAAVREVTHTKAMGLELYTTYLLAFEIAGLILLVAVIGGLVLARREQGQPPDHEGDEVVPPAHRQLDNNEEVRR
ncbi:NADH-quinone oxidoreductase subunit J family protein [Desulfobulbus alkaliphilus]|uniref:NADH-quinone oxidoreductase subunit J family protein n=1 Tax=Desulfobulbus alkaliphilus TaxID=869814 RepID=UPI001964DF68|nr:NADH-quinone oxidoreductase subunit J [Desulfobulbus alkaliphilus]MBM9536269.1 NADH-quinone oxidoreductase subunit J [Desulfobulbus alkaliphilus]